MASEFKWPPFRLISACLLLPLFMAILCGCANPVFEAYQSTAIFGPTRGVFSVNDKYYFEFPYRGGYVTYEPYLGAYWSRSALGRSQVDWVDGKSGDPPYSDTVVRGCLIYACKKAETIRLGRLPGASRAQVIGYQRIQKGGGHSFVVYDYNGRTIAEDPVRRVPVSQWTKRTPDQALRTAREFTRTTFNGPKVAAFYGDF